MSDNDKVKRKYTRFGSEENTLLTVKTREGKLILGLAFSEAYEGCGGVFIKSSSLEEIQLDDTYEVKVGNHHFVRMIVKWKQELDADTVKIGFKVI